MKKRNDINLFNNLVLDEEEKLIEDTLEKLEISQEDIPRESFILKLLYRTRPAAQY